MSIHRAAMLAVGGGALVVASCNRGPTPTPTPVGGAPAAPTQTPGQPPAAAPTAAPGARGGGGGPGGAGRGAITPDSAAKLRQPYVDQLMAQIAGRENQPATEVFKNVQVLKTLTAGQLVTTMNAYGRALTRNCTGCHIASDWSSDSLRGKRSARVMQEMVNAINSEHLPRLSGGGPGPQPAGPPPATAAGGAAGGARGGAGGRGGGGVTCMTCHHGLGRPNQSFDASIQAPPAGPGRGGQ